METDGTDALGDGLAALDAGHVERALALFERAAELAPRAPEPRVYRAVALARLGRLSDALACARACLREHVGHALALELIDRLERGELGRIERGVAPTPGPWRVGEVVAGRWEVFGSAEGGMGRVYFVRDREWSAMELAVKSLVDPGWSTDERARAEAMFRREAQVWLDLGAHAHIVSGFYTLELDGALRFFMEYVPGSSLAHLLREAKAGLPLPRSVDLAIQLAAGMEYVHARGAVHRDLKPANCLVSAGDELRVTDFGLGKGRAPGEAAGTIRWTAPDLSRRGAGTPHYMPPEQWGSLAAAGPASDVYALGVVLYQLVTGHPPFEVSSWIWQRHASRLPSSLEKLVRARARVPEAEEALVERFHREIAPIPLAEIVALPGDLEALILACLDKEPARRPTMAAVRQQLAAIYPQVADRAPYQRRLPAELAPSEAGESNRAASYYVMGELHQARAILEAAPAPWLIAAANRWVMILNEGGDPENASGSLDERVMEHQLGAESRSPAFRSLRNQLRRRFLGWGDDAAGFDAAGRHLHTLRFDGPAWDHMRRSTLEIATGEVSEHSFEVPRVRPASRTVHFHACFSSDGRHFALTNQRGVAVHETDTLDRVGEVLLGLGEQATLAVAPGGRSLAVGDGPRLYLVEVARGTVRRLDPAGRARHATAPTPMAFSGDGSLLVALDDVVERVDVTAGTSVWSRARGADAHIHWVAISSDGRIAASKDVAGRIDLWDASCGERLFTMSVPPSTGAGLARDGRLLATGPADGEITVWEVESGRRVQGLRFPRSGGAAYYQNELAFSPDGRQLFVRAGGHLYLVPLEGWPRLSMVVVRPHGAPERVRFAGERAELIRRAHARDVHAYRELRALVERAPELVRDREILAAIDALGRARGLRTGVADAWCLWHAHARPNALNEPAPCFDPGGTSVLCARDDELEELDLETGRRLRVIAKLDRPPASCAASQISALAVSQDGQRILIGLTGAAVPVGIRPDDPGLAFMTMHPDLPFLMLTPEQAAIQHPGRNDAELRDRESGALLGTLPGGRAGIRAVALAPAGDLAATVTAEGEGTFWETASARPLGAFTCAAGELELTRDGRFLAFAHGGRARIVAVPSGDEVRSFGEDGDFITCVSLSHDERRVLTRGRRCRIWIVATGELDRELPFHERESPALPVAWVSPRTSRRKSVAWFPDDRLISVSGERRVYLFDLARCELVASCEIDVLWPAISLSGDGRHMLLGGSQTAVWRLDSEWAMDGRVR